MRSFVVASWEQGRQRRRDLRRVEADTAEHAVLKAAASRPSEKQNAVYEAWLSTEPEHNLRMTLVRHGG